MHEPCSSGGVYWSLHEVLEAKRQAAALASHADQPPVLISAGMNLTERSIATLTARRTPRSEARAAEAVKLVGQHGNPWKTSNRTHQGIVTNKNPALAARLKAEAGIKP